MAIERQQKTKGKRGHLLLPFGRKHRLEICEFQEAISFLGETHDWLADHATKYLALSNNTRIESWATLEKRRVLSWPAENLPVLVGKTEERFVEIVNQLATTERMLDTLKWAKENFPGTVIESCHPSTSGTKGECDLVLGSKDNSTLLFEITDTVGGNNNGKFEETLMKFGLLFKNSLGDFERVPTETESIHEYYIGTSIELRNWALNHESVFQEDWQIGVVQCGQIENADPLLSTYILKIVPHRASH